MPEHKWRHTGCGYDPARYCDNCHANDYQTSTNTCEEYIEALEVAKQLREGTHQPTNDALSKARGFLTKEEWHWLGLGARWEHRVIDRIQF